MRPPSPPKRSLPATWLVGKLVRLRAVEPDDVPLLQRWSNTAVGAPWLSTALPQSRREELAWAARLSTDPKRPGFIIQTRRGQDIGVITLIVNEARAELGIAIHDPRYWSRGYGEDAVRVLVDGAFRSLPLRRIELLVIPENIRAIRCYEKVGFAREGLLRKYRYHGGIIHDTIIMSILHEEWAAHREESS
jgi:RimJ/RimL family protein N-acetyltransferase